jgi:glycosyltransferase involved in cell wall biosynthesis
LRVLIKSPMNPHSGYGNDGLALAMGFQQAGCDVYLDPAAVQTPLPWPVAELLTKRLKPPFDLLVHHWDPPHLGISPGARQNSTVTVAWSMWEMTSLDNCPGRSHLRKRLKDYDLVVGYDDVSTGALARYVTTNAATVQGGYWPKFWQPQPRDWNAPVLNFCMVGQLGPRKDPFVAIEAFRELREENPDMAIALNIKTNSPGLHSKLQDLIPGLRIYYDVWPDEVLRDFYYSQHILLAPSRGEGKNLPALEMLSTGGTVIATNWGGHRQWLSPALGYQLNFELEPLSNATPDCLWAKASKQHLKELMRHAYESRYELSRKAQAGTDLIPQMCNWPTVLDRLMDRVGETNERGERVLHKYRVAKSQAEEKAAIAALL